MEIQNKHAYPYLHLCLCIGDARDTRTYARDMAEREAEEQESSGNEWDLRWIASLPFDTKVKEWNWSLRAWVI